MCVCVCVWCPGNMSVLAPGSGLGEGETYCMYRALYGVQETCQFWLQAVGWVKVSPVVCTVRYISSDNTHLHE